MSEVEADVINISDLDDLTFDLNNDDIKIDNISDNIASKQSSNFGPGIELLMNDKKKNSSDGENPNSGNIDLDDITKLENDLNEPSKTVQNKNNIFNNLFNNKNKPENITIN